MCDNSENVFKAVLENLENRGHDIDIHGTYKLERKAGSYCTLRRKRIKKKQVCPTVESFLCGNFDVLFVFKLVRYGFGKKSHF